MLAAVTVKAGELSWRIGELGATAAAAARAEAARVIPGLLKSAMPPFLSAVSRFFQERNASVAGVVRAKSGASVAAVVAIAGTVALSDGEMG